MANISEQDNNGILTSSRRNKLIIYIILGMVINIVLTYLMPTHQANHLSGQSASPDEIRNSTILTILIILPVLGFILGAIASLFPYKNLKYSGKYLQFSLMAMLLLEITILVLSVSNLIFPG